MSVRGIWRCKGERYVKMSREPKTFDKAAFGYKTEEVDRYIAELHRQIAALEADKAEQQAKMKILADKVTEYRSDESSLKDALLEAQRMKSAIEGEAKAHAEQVVADAESRAQQLKNDAKTHATRLLSEAKNRAGQMVADAQRQADEAVGAVRGQVEKEKRILARMQREVSSFKSTLISIYRSHLNLITSLPEEERKGADAAALAGAAAGKQAAEGVGKASAPEAAPEKRTVPTPQPAESEAAANAPEAAAEAEASAVAVSPGGSEASADDAAQKAAFTQRFGEVRLEGAGNA